MNRMNRISRFNPSIMALAMACMIDNASAGDGGGERAPVWYIVKEKSLVGNELHEAGAMVQYAGLPSENLEPTDDEGRRRAQEYQESNKKRQADLVANNKESAVGDPQEFAKALAKAFAQDRAEQDERIANLLRAQEESGRQFAQASQNMAKLISLLSANHATQPVSADGQVAVPVENTTGTPAGPAATGDQIAPATENKAPAPAVDHSDEKPAKRTKG